MADTNKKKIAILGGGMASLTAAHELTDYEGWQDNYEITVYQTGWRLGGKTATGRGRCNRIEEHGIHILQGWYDTTFRLLRAVYEERRKRNLAPGSPLQDLFKDGLQRNNTTLLTEFDPKSGKWTNWPLVFPETKGLPGEGGPLPVSELIRKGLAMMLEIALGSPYQEGINPISKWILDHFFPKDGVAGPAPEKKTGWLATVLKSLFGKGGLLTKLLPLKVQFLMEALHLTGGESPEEQHERFRKIVGFLGKIVDKMEHKAQALFDKSPNLRHVNLMLAFSYYNLKGILEDVYDPETGKFNFRNINGYDYREWLQKHGAPDWLRYSVIVRFFYTGTFSNLVNEQGGAIGAGTALQFFVNSIGYKGSFVFQFVYGTGDVMVMPMYEVLKSRGVQFKFFHEIEQVHYSAGGSIESVSYAEQVKLAVPEYDPVKMIGDLATWPAEPLYEQIAPEYVEKLKAGNVDLENPWADWTPYRKSRLKKGDDFDEIILGIPVGTLKTICSEIIEKEERWQLMADNVQTTPTQSAQLWFLPALKELGFDPDEWGLPPVGGAPNVVVYQNPMYSWLDSSLVLPNEDWPEGLRPNFLAYFTGPMPLRHPLPPFSDHAYPKEELDRLIDSFEQWLNDNAGWFWPNGGTDTYPQGLNFQLLADPDNNPEGFQRLLSQFFRANVRPTDHYTLSVPKSEQYRFKTDGSGFDNLFLCGDWIDFGINVGYIDGAIQSGLQAGQALRAKSGLGGHKELWNRG